MGLVFLYCYSSAEIAPTGQTLTASSSPSPVTTSAKPASPIAKSSGYVPAQHPQPMHKP